MYRDFGVNPVNLTKPTGISSRPGYRSRFRWPATCRPARPTAPPRNPNKEFGQIPALHLGTQSIHVFTQWLMRRITRLEMSDSA